MKGNKTLANAKNNQQIIIELCMLVQVNTCYSTMALHYF